MVCPFCGWTNEAGEYEMLLVSMQTSTGGFPRPRRLLTATSQHIETLHAEGDSPFVVKEDVAPEGTTPAEDVQYVECPVDSCGEVLVLQELDYHLELHSEESGEPLPEGTAPAPDLGTDTQASTTGPSRAHRDAERHRQPDHDSKNDRQAHAISAWKRLLRMPSVSTAQRILSSKRSHDDAQTPAGHSTRGKRLGVSGLGSHPASIPALPCP